MRETWHRASWTTRLLTLSCGVAAGLLVIACVPPPTAGGDVNDNVNNDANTPDEDPFDDDGDDEAAIALTGRLDPGAIAKRRPRLQAGEWPFTIVAQSDATGEIYRTETDDDGTFALDLPPAEAGSTFTVTILGPDGRAVGPVVFDQDGDEGFTGLALDRSADLGTLELPDDPAAASIVPGADGDAAELVDPAITTLLGPAGAPIGLATFGKGENVGQIDGTGERRTDVDQDGLIDIFDADDDADGIVDDFDTGEAGGGLTDTRVNFFMNLKINAEVANTYYSGSADAIANRLKTDTVITLEALMEPGATREIMSVRLLETPGPSYLPIATVDRGQTLWHDADYAFDEHADRFDVFVTPNAVMEPGDSFTAEISYTDGTTVQYTRMINYIFKNIPKLVRYGPGGALVDFDIDDAVVNGSLSHPIPVDPTQDLVLEFQPPRDENGDPITGMDYTLQFFFYDDFGGQLDVDLAATWPTLPDGMEAQRTVIWIAAEELGELSGAGVYSVTVPRECFVASVETEGGDTVAVGGMKIDVTAECSSGNAAIMLAFERQ